MQEWRVWEHIKLRRQGGVVQKRREEVVVQEREFVNIFVKIMEGGAGRGGERGLKGL